MELEVPKRHILRPTLSTDTAQHVLLWERQKRRSKRRRQGPWQRNIIIINFNEIVLAEEKMKTKEDKKTIKLERSFFSFFSKLPFLSIYQCFFSIFEFFFFQLATQITGPRANQQANKSKENSTLNNFLVVVNEGACKKKVFIIIIIIIWRLEIG